MSYNDTLSDGLARIRNAVLINKEGVEIRHSKLVESCIKVLKKEGYVADYMVKDNSPGKVIYIVLKYYNGKSVINYMKRISKSSRRVFSGVDNLPMSLNGLGSYIVSTSKGVMVDHESRNLGVGGEVLFEIY